MTYDGNGNIASRTDCNGNTSCFAYDLSRNLEAALIEEATTDATGALGLSATLTGSQSITAWTPSIPRPRRNMNNVIARHTCDKRGNRIGQSKTSGTGNMGSCAYRYDGADHLSGSACPSRRTVDSERDTAGLIGAVTTTLAQPPSPLSGELWSSTVRPAD